MSHHLADPLIAAPQWPEDARGDTFAPPPSAPPPDLPEAPPALAALETAAGAKLAPWLESERLRLEREADASWWALLERLRTDLAAELGSDAAACVLCLMDLGDVGGLCARPPRPSAFTPGCRGWEFSLDLRGRRSVECRYLLSEVRGGWVRQTSGRFIDTPAGPRMGLWVVELEKGICWASSLGDALWLARLPEPEAPPF